MRAAAGIVSIQAIIMLLAIFHFTEEAFLMVPIPRMEPVMVCVVLTGTPSAEET